MIKKEDFRKKHSYTRGMLVSFSRHHLGKKYSQLGMVVGDRIESDLALISLGGRYWYRILSSDKTYLVSAEDATRL
jgi:hypothetical protein